MTTNNTLKTASVLAFERKLDPSDALLSSGSWSARHSTSGWTPVTLREKSVRGTISNRLKTKDQDPAKLDAAIENPNLQTVDVAALPADADTLKVSFSLRVLSGAGTPNACNNADYQTKLLTTVRGYVNSVGFGELASRYAYNLANGRFLWRNRMGAEQVEVQVQHMVDGKAHKAWTFDGLALSMRDFTAGGSAPLQELGEVIAAGLAGQSHVLLQVTAFARLGAGQEVYPSQELILEKQEIILSDGKRTKKSKTLYKVGSVAGIHSQKLGNAIRTIDTWHPEVAEVGPIAVEPYGSITTLGKACRKPGDKIDFYNLLDNWLLKDKAPEQAQQHFVMAILIRGGVFGDAGKE
jgi:CRISPR-associated protein Csy3